MACATFVYFIQPIGGGPIKIGVSATPLARLYCLTSWSPVELSILAEAPGDHATEGQIHWKFRAHRQRGEWFAPAPELLDYIDTVKRTGEIPDAVFFPKLPYSLDDGEEIRLDEHLLRVGATKQDICDFLGITRFATANWTRRIPDHRIAALIEFFAARGLALKAADFTVAIKKKRTRHAASRPTEAA